MTARITAVILLAASTTLAQDWPAWRGPSGDGVAAADDAPLHWDRESNVKWKVPLAQPANGSPIVVGERVFLTMPEDPEGKRRSLYCFARDDGEQLWVRTVDFGRVMPTHSTNPYGATTPACDGERVVVWHASAGLHCYSVDGEPLWQRDLGEFRHMWGYGTSPILHGGNVILNTGPGESSFVAAFDLETGKTVWKTIEPNHLDEAAIAKKRLVGSWCTPLIERVGDRDLVLCGQPTRVVAYDASTGEEVWWSRGVSSSRGDLTYSSPVVAGDVCMVAGGYDGPLIGVLLDPEAAGDVTEDYRLWHHPRQLSNCASGIAIDDAILIPEMDGFLWCIDTVTGERRWRERVGRGPTWGSIVSAGGRLYLMNQRGTTIVFAPDADRLRVLAQNDLGEPTNSTPAIVGGEIFLRTHQHLYCIAEPE